MRLTRQLFWDRIHLEYKIAPRTSKEERVRKFNIVGVLVLAVGFISVANSCHAQEKPASAICTAQATQTHLGSWPNRPNGMVMFSFIPRDTSFCDVFDRLRDTIEATLMQGRTVQICNQSNGGCVVYFPADAKFYTEQPATYQCYQRPEETELFYHNIGRIIQKSWGRKPLSSVCSCDERNVPESPLVPTCSKES